MSAANGGYYTDNRTIIPLRTGAASFVVYKDGSFALGQWGSDVSMTPSVVSVRQNLDLLVDNGQIVPAAYDANSSAWGATLGGGLYVWRSALGITANGALLYVGGPGLDIYNLANIMVHAGAVRAMELDINTDWVNFSSYQPSTPGRAGHARQRHRAAARNDRYAWPLLPAVVGPRLHHHVGGGRPVTSVGSVPRQEPLPQNGVVPLHDLGPTAPRSTLGLLAQGARPRQWLKNLLVFMAPAAAGVLGEWHTTLRVVVAFLIFCVVASGTYLVNDVVDAGADEYHPVKRLRPVASGALRPGVALAAGAALIATAIAGAVLIGPWGFAVVVASYAAIEHRLQHPLEARARHGAGRGRALLRVARRRRRRGGRRAALQLVPRLHLVRRLVHRERKALLQSTPDWGATGECIAPCSISTASHSSSRP